MCVRKGNIEFYTEKITHISVLWLFVTPITQLVHSTLSCCCFILRHTYVQMKGRSFSVINDFVIVTWTA